jgi:hypothetical protein
MKFFKTTERKLHKCANPVFISFSEVGKVEEGIEGSPLNVFGV